MKLKVFLFCNPGLSLAALVSRYSILRNTRHAKEFEIELLNEQDFGLLRTFDDTKILWGGKLRRWRYDSDLSFTLLRLIPPQLMNYQGRAAVIEADTLVLGDIYDLLTKDMSDFDGLTCPIEAVNPKFVSHQGSVMLLDCNKVRWDLKSLFDGLVRREYDYLDLMRLKLERKFGSFEKEWNHFDTLTDQTKILHYTDHSTQPWRTGLRSGKSYRRGFGFRPIKKVLKLLRFPDKLRGLQTKYYPENPIPRQRDLWFRYLKESLDRGIISEAILREAIHDGHLRKDVFECIESSSSVDDYHSARTV